MFETGPRTVWRQCYTWGDRFWLLRIEAWGNLLHKEVVAVILFLTVLIRLITVIDIKKNAHFKQVCFFSRKIACLLIKVAVQLFHKLVVFRLKQAAFYSKHDLNRPIKDGFCHGYFIGISHCLGKSITNFSRSAVAPQKKQQEKYDQNPETRNAPEVSNISNNMKFQDYQTKKKIVTTKIF